MNIMHFLTPKSSVAYLTDNSTVRNGYEKMSFHAYRAITVISPSGEYVGTVTEGDILRDFLARGGLEPERVCIRDIIRPNWNPPVNVNATVEQLFSRVTEQNFVPVTDDRGIFIGIVTRKAVIRFLTDSYFEKEKTE